MRGEGAPRIVKLVKYANFHFLMKKVQTFPKYISKVIFQNKNPYINIIRQNKMHIYSLCITFLLRRV